MIRTSTLSSRIAVICAALATLIALAAPISAQETTGTVRGRVIDAQGLAVPGVTITVTGVQGVDLEAS